MFGLFDPIEDGAAALDKAFSALPAEQKQALANLARDLLGIMARHEGPVMPVLENESLQDALVDLAVPLSMRVARRKTAGLLTEILKHAPTLKGAVDAALGASL